MLMLVLLLQIPAVALPAKEEKNKKKRKAAQEVTVEEKVKSPAPSVAQEHRAAVEEAVMGMKNLSGSIRGEVADGKGNPITGVEVSCVDALGRVVARTVTDSEGAYEFGGLAEGQYTIHVNYSGFSPPVEIKFEGKPQRRPPIPTGLQVFEIVQDYPDGGIIRAQWDKMPGATAYRPELFRQGEREPVQTLPDMKQNFSEFGNVLEDTDYQVRVYAKNEAGYSSSYALGLIHTMNRPPLTPYGLGVTSAINNRVELVWNSVPSRDLKGYVLQIKKSGGQYLYYSKKGLTPDAGKAFVIEKGRGQLESYVIEDRLEGGVPLIENVKPYSFRVLAVDGRGAFSKPSNSLEGVMLEDTIPPSPPHSIKYEFIAPDRLKIQWEANDTDIERYKLYYGVNPDRWDGMVFTDKNFYELLINREQLESRELRMAIVAIDRAGNESGYRPLTRSTSIARGDSVKEDIVLSSGDMYRDFSVAIREPPKVVAPKKPEVAKKVPPVRKPKEYGFSYLREKGFVVSSGETATIKGTVQFPGNAIVVVQSGGRLIIEGADLRPEGELWGGIRFLEGSVGTVSNSSIRDAAIGIAVLNSQGSVKIKQLTVDGCRESGIHIKNSTLELSMINVSNNVTGILIEDSRVHISDSIVEKNEKGILARTNQLNVEGSQFKNNSSYGLRLYGGGTIRGSVFKDNLVGIVFEEGRGLPVLIASRIENNRMDGVVVAAADAEMSRNVISGNGRHGIYVKENANPSINENDIVSNSKYGVVGGGKIWKCYVAYNNGSIYIDDTEKKGLPDNVFSSSSSGVLKQILNVDYIDELSGASVLQ